MKTYDEFIHMLNRSKEYEFDNHTTLIYTINTEENVIGVHCRQSMVFVPEIHNLKDYLASQFVDSFRQHQNFHARLNALKSQAVPTDNK